MKKRLLAILMATAMSMSLIACGGGEEEVATKGAAVEEEAVEEEAEVEVSGDYTEDQLAYLEAYQQMLDDYNAAVNFANVLFKYNSRLLERRICVPAANPRHKFANTSDDPAQESDQKTPDGGIAFYR